MKYSCPECLCPTTHLLEFNYNDICFKCSDHKLKETVDWSVEKEELHSLINKYKKNKRDYDCIVPVLGDANDYYTLLKVLDLGLSPLIICVNDYYKNDIGWHNLHQLTSYFDVDSLLFNPDIHTYKDLVRTSLRKYNNILLPFLQLQKFFPIHIAYQRNIPLIIRGERKVVEDFNRNPLVNNNELLDVDTLIGSGAQVNPLHLNFYKNEINLKTENRSVKEIYLSDFLPWDPLSQNKNVVNYGFQPEANTSSFDTYDNAGSSVYYGLHDLLRLKKVGYRKIQEHAAREIRQRRITREQALKLINHFSKSPVTIKPFFDWLGVTSSGYEWFKLHQLNGYNHLVNDGFHLYENIPYPDNLKHMIQQGQHKKKDHVTFGKGL
ncbi:MAG: N-acetyl sugar amidotransferase [Candidatus Acinetobacter avistercoris]|nr:N-acetyl sugar amidotransferase [Candidatus Acinetobacter avistercoris]